MVCLDDVIRRRWGGGGIGEGERDRDRPGNERDGGGVMVYICADALPCSSDFGHREFCRSLQVFGICELAFL